jgi:protein-L-isoaspartate(D-aspartate) O-methyltransferase
MVARPVDQELRGARLRLVETLRDKGIRDLAVLRAFEQTPRHQFLPSGLRHRAYEDFPAVDTRPLSRAAQPNGT